MNRQTQYDEWCVILHEHYAALSPDRRLRSDFNATVRAFETGYTKYIECICDPCGGTRGHQHIRQDPQEAMGIEVVLSGVERFEVGGQRVTLQAGDIFFWNTIQPVRFEVVERLHKLTVKMPLHRLESWLPQSWQTLSAYHPKDSAVASLVGGLVCSTKADFFAGRVRNGDTFTDVVLGMLISAMNPPKAPTSLDMGAAYRIRAQDYISQHLHRASMATEEIAEAIGVSIRYLQKLFQHQGMTIRQYIIRERLTRCHRDLANPAMSHRSVAEIAFSWGFQSAAHFSRRFKAAYDQTPTAYRQAKMQ